MDADVTAVGKAAVELTEAHMIKARLDTILDCAERLPKYSEARTKLVSYRSLEAIRLGWHKVRDRIEGK
jgi:hypothetical protein